MANGPWREGLVVERLLRGRVGLGVGSRWGKASVEARLRAEEPRGRSEV